MTKVKVNLRTWRDQDRAICHAEASQDGTILALASGSTRNEALSALVAILPEWATIPFLDTAVKADR